MNLLPDIAGRFDSDQDRASAVDAPTTGDVQETTVDPARGRPFINTNVAMTVTPASTGVSAVTPSASTIPGPNNSVNLESSTSLNSLPNNTQTPPTAAIPRAGILSTLPDQTWFDRSSSPQTRGTGVMADAMSAAKNPGLIRRLSRGAQNKIRRRASTTHSMRMRDLSAGPNSISRRLSDSHDVPDYAQDVSDLELDGIDKPSTQPLWQDSTNALGISDGRPSFASTASATLSNRFVGGIAPSCSVLLENGTWCWKITKRHRKRIRLWLDSNSARVCWHSFKTNKSFFIDDVSDVRSGADSRNARDDVQIPADQEDRWLTIVYNGLGRSNGRTIKTMHLLMDDDYMLKMWVDALDGVTRQRIAVMNALSTSPEKADKALALAWGQAMQRKSAAGEERFSLEDARWLCRKLEINCSDSTIRTHFKTVSNSESMPLDYEQYVGFVRSFRDRKDIQRIYTNQQFGTDLDMDLLTFLNFLKSEQMIDVVKERSHWEGIFDKFARPSQNRPSLPDAESKEGQRTLNMQSFQSFLTSSSNAPLLWPKGEPVLDKPLNEYFISSSHNTYLLGRQVAGASSVEGYIAALIKGCRCVEIDCWDGDDGRPRVTHGRTMTTKISFEDCVSVIAKYAFNSSPYPLIVSLEVHCNSDQQLAMVELMKKHFHTMMVTEPLVPNPATLPSPEELKNRILIKVKASEDPDQSQPLAEATNGRSRARSIGSAWTRTPSFDNPQLVYSPNLLSPATASPADSNTCSTPRGSTNSGTVNTPSTSADDSDDTPTAFKKSKKRRPGIIPELGKLGVYTQGIKFHGFHAPNAKTFNHVYSFNEDTFEKHSAKATDSKALLEKHNTRYLMRVYPAPLRIDSSNFSPMRSWRRGVQMVALNWQTYDVHQQVNEAMFAAGSDRFGYVLKPDQLRHAKHLPIADTLPEALGKKEKKGKKLVKVGMDIISAQRLPRPRGQNPEVGMNPFVEFEIFAPDDKEDTRGAFIPEGGVDASTRDSVMGDEGARRRRSRVVEGNGFDPCWSAHYPMKVETKFPSLIFVRWTIWNAPEGRVNSNNNVVLASFTAKLDALQQGYRHLPLFNPQGEQYRDAKLFVKIRKEVPIPIEREDSAPGILDQLPKTGSPRPEPLRSERSWPFRGIILSSRNASRKRENSINSPSRSLSRTSSLER